MGYNTEYKVFSVLVVFLLLLALRKKCGQRIPNHRTHAVDSESKIPQQLGNCTVPALRAWQGSLTLDPAESHHDICLYPWHL